MSTTQISRTRRVELIATAVAALLTALVLQLTLSPKPAEAIPDCDPNCPDPETHFPPSVDVENSSVTVPEGQTVTNTGIYSDTEDTDTDSVTITASVGTVTKSGTDEGTWDWSYTPNDGPATTTVTITAEDSTNRSSTTHFSLAVLDVAPAATLNAPASAVTEGSSFSISLTNPQDPSSVDMAAGFTYAFDCGSGSGFGSFGSSNSASCPTNDNGTLTVRGRIRDKDGGISEAVPRTVTVDNAKPTATFNTPASVNVASPFNISLTDPQDPSSVDKSALKYAFDCGSGSGYSTPASTSTATCTAGSGPSQTVKGKVIDKDGGETEYTRAIEVKSGTTTTPHKVCTKKKKKKKKKCQIVYY